MEQDFEMIPVSSSQIESVGYSDVTSKLRISFSKGGIYEYDNVSQEEFDALVAAPSVGSLFQQTIKNRKPYRKL
jgi:KTSC domain